MKKFILLLFCPIVFLAQTNETTDSKYVDKEYFPKIYNKYLTEAILGDSDLSTMGSYVSVDIVKPKLSFAVTKNYYRNDFLKSSTSLKIDVGIKDGVSSIFSNEKYNKDLNIRLDKNFVIGYKSFTRFKFIKKDNIKLNKAIDSLKIRDTEHKNHVKILKGRIVNFKDKSSEAYYNALLQLEEIEKIEYQSKINKKFDDARWTSVRLAWINFFAKYGTQKLNIYDVNADFDNQLTDISPENHELGLGLNMYYNQVRDLDKKYKNHWAYIFNGQYSIKYSYAGINNSSELSTSKIVTETEVGNNINNSRFIEKITNAYEIGTFDDYKRHQIALDINKKIKNNLHFHIFYDWNKIKDSDKYNGSYSNLGLGFVVGVKKKGEADKETIVNFELFSHFRDLGDKFKVTGDKFYKRATIGIRTTVPFDNLLKRN